MDNNQMTIDDLAVVVKAGFDEVHTKMDSGFNTVNQRLNKVDERLDRVENRLDRVENRLDSIESKLIFISREMEEIKIELEKLSARTIADDNALSSEVVKLKDRIAILEQQVKQLKTSHS